MLACTSHHFCPPSTPLLTPLFSFQGTDGDDLGLQHDPQCEQKFLDSITVSRAFENECCVIFVNAGGKKEEGWIGRSGISLPFKGKIGGTKDEKEEMVCVEVDLGILEAS